MAVSFRMFIIHYRRLSYEGEMVSLKKQKYM
jgi:hypothetical protein